ncbi:cytochrome P450 [Ilyonectria destructans]|nr:cytochrome P450 [Ilyonectria destructans]
MSILTATISTLGALFAAFVVWVFVGYAHVLNLRRKMPPGPFPFPFFGNVGRVPASKPWRTFDDWSKHYKSPLLTLWNGTHPTVVINDCWTANELLDKRANIYSSRPHFILIGDLLDSTTTNQTMLPYGDTWRLHRKIMHGAVGSQAVRSYRSFQANESKLLAQDLLENSGKENYVDFIERYSCSVVTIIGWGRRISHTGDYLAQIAISFVQGAALGNPCQYIIESYPWLAKLPAWLYPLPSILWNSGQKSLKYFYALSVEGAEANEENFAKRLLREREEHGLNYKEIATLTANLVGGGVDTTTSTIMTFLFAMCVFPDVQRKAQEEIDRVIGDRVPDWSDEDHLPYTKALVTEVYRWRSVFVLGGPPHAPIQDDFYDGFLIPKGTTIIGNVWAMHRNPRDYPDPDNFRPERFMDGAERRPHPTKKGLTPFGWGRRQCSGQPLAEQGIWFTAVELLWAFKMRAVDDKGNDRKLDIFAFNDSPVSRPLPFKMEFKPRSEEIASKVHEEAKNARHALRIYDGETKITMESAQENFTEKVVVHSA